MKDILFFIVGATLLHMSHNCFLWRLKKGYSSKTNGNNTDLFKSNKPYQFTEKCFMLLNVGYASLVPAIVYSNSPNINAITVFAVITILVGSIQSGIDISKQGSFFRFSDLYLQWNFALGNSCTRTVKIELKDVFGIDDKVNYLEIILNNSKNLKIRKSELELLNGFGVLKERLLSLNSEIQNN